ncbi:hypothetical protein WICPIJ_001611 [Wickerhamomyces pijperi]|uniref:Photolyase/cryptochrome alpha/beta domain-containing protein n=1 Tax=Wickerhamomyces pijperi TaxID=599730 RepID=A0A9P8QAL2_WICPI|nr:hypothetical protein WICPIJ_001611 [Wickerhamomyces pijperi]
MSKRIKLSPSSTKISNKYVENFWNKFLEVNPNFYEPKNRLDRIKANQFNNGKRAKPYRRLQSAIENHPFVEPQSSETYLVHWFRNDLRIHDNLALLKTIELGHKLNKKVITVYIFNEFDLRRHMDSVMKIDFIKRSLVELRQSLNDLNIPLEIIHTDRTDFVPYFTQLIKEKYQTSTVSFNTRYEWDEINTDIEIIDSGAFNVYCPLQDQLIIEPFQLQTGKGTMYSKFTPWWKSWAKKTLELYKTGRLECLKNPKAFEAWESLERFNKDEGQLDKEFSLETLLNEQLYKGIITQSDLQNLPELYKPGEKAAYQTFNNYLETNSIAKYTTAKDPPQISGSTHLSHHLTQGTISPRYIFHELVSLNQGKIIGGNINVETLIKELAWREFFRHLVCNWPYCMMYVPTNLNSLDLHNENSREKFQKWAQGETGFPIVDACMRQLLKTGYMNNRCRMICSSFLAKDLNVDYRAGELWFYQHLIDGDFISNNQGWQWTTSTGLDSQPWFRIFNVHLQSEKFDKECLFIKHWIPQLEGFETKQIHYAQGLSGYFKPCIDRDAEREATLERYREAMSTK